MKAKEEYEVRAKMAEMHEDFIEKMSEAYDNGFYIETVWYCYAIIEQRVNRLIAKYIERCTICPKRTDDKSASISTRIVCLKKLINAKYGAYDILSTEIFERISDWCEKRNDLVHGLVSFKHYRKYDEEFKELAELGVPLIFELYDVCTDFRNHWYEMEAPTEEFPIKTCKCNKKQCINADSI